MTREEFYEKNIDEIYEIMEKARTKIFDRHKSDWKYYKKGIKVDENLVYVTINAGLGGIYTMINTFKNGDWETKVLDDSITIYYKEYKEEL